MTKSDIEHHFCGAKVLKEFPQSGQKQVYLIDHESYGVTILKVVKNGDLRVMREIEILTDYEIMNVPKIIALESYTANGIDYIVIFEEFIEGLTLDEKIKSGKLTTKEGIDLLRTLLEICVKLEEINIVHRDIKPGNIICGNKGKYYLIDFGIARQLDKVSLTMTHMNVGPHSPGYGAPELYQYKKKDIDSRADLFSIGVVMFESLTGKHPFLSGDESDYDEIWYKMSTIIPKDYIIEGDGSFQLMGFIQTLMQRYIQRRPDTVKKAMEWFEALLPTIQF